MYSWPDTLPRPLLALTVIVAMGAIYVGVEDYVGHQKKAQPPASTSTPTEVHSNARTRPRKTASAKVIRARVPNEANAAAVNAPATKPATPDKVIRAGVATEVNAPAVHAPGTEQAAPVDGEKASVSQESAKAGEKAIVAADDGPTTGRSARAANGEIKAAGDRNGRVPSEFDPSACVPLPNLTKPGDADTLYYENWAREYNCGI